MAQGGCQSNVLGDYPKVVINEARPQTGTLSMPIYRAHHCLCAASSVQILHQGTNLAILAITADNTLLSHVPGLQSERFGKHFASFGREAAMLADLNHPNVLRFYGVVTEGVNDNTVIGIMTEYIRGGSLSSFLR